MCLIICYVISDGKGVGCITVANDDNALHSETKPSNTIIDYVVKEATPLRYAQRSESETPLSEATTPSSSATKSEHVSSDSDVQSSQHKVAVIKNTFDLNLQPSSNDSDIQSNDQDSFELSNSRPQFDNNGSWFDPT